MADEMRPTRDMVREAVFNVLAGYIEGARVLDLFAGSGAFGIEAISRGASYAVFMDNSAEAVKIMKKNIKILDTQDADKTEVMAQDIRPGLRILSERKDSFGIIFLDPPYYKGLVKKSLKYISVYDILSQPNLIIAEHSKKDEIPEAEGSFRLSRRLRYGETIISIYTKAKA